LVAYDFLGSTTLSTAFSFQIKIKIYVSKGCVFFSKLVYQNIPKVYSNQYSVQKVGKNLDASEKWYKKAEMHDLGKVLDST
jgi:hypothetical protein